MRTHLTALIALSGLAVACSDPASTNNDVPEPPGDAGQQDTDPQPDTLDDTVDEPDAELPPEPPYEPSAEIEILIDTRGIPHIYGQNDEDAFFGAGYQMATDRLFQMAMTRRRAYGRLSEVIGREGLEDDELARLFKWQALGRTDAARMRTDNPESWSVVTAWISGVNRRIEEVRSGEASSPFGFEDYDFEPELWSPHDPLVIGKMTGFGNDLSLEYELFATIAQKYLPEAYDALEIALPAREVYTLPPEDRADLTGACFPSPTSRPAPTRPGTAPDPQEILGAFATLQRRFSPLRVVGSNNWAVDGRFTQSGRPLIAGDPHQGFDLPGIFYALHINSKDAGGSFNVAGVSFAGVPGVSIGQTDKVIWTVTTSFADVMDIWQVRSASDEGGVIIGDMTVETIAREEVIIVREEGDPVGEGKTFSYTYKDVPGYGIILPADIVPIPVADQGRELLLNWTGFAPRDGRGLLELNRAGSIDDYDAAVESLSGMNFNFVAADAEGITFNVGVQVPERDLSTGLQPWLVLDGDDPDTFWTGAKLPRERLPHSRAAERGFLLTANNDPFGFTEDGILDNDPWYYGAFFAPGWRAGRIEAELTTLTERGDLTLEEMKALQLDLHSNLADDLLPALTAARDALPTEDALVAFRDRPEIDALATLLLDGWDRQMHRDSTGALIFHAWAHFLTGHLLADDFRILYSEAMALQAVFILKFASLAVRGHFESGDALIQEGLQLLIYTALDETAAWLTATWGSADPTGHTFGEMHHTSFDGSLGTGIDLGAIPTDGGESTVNVSPSAFLDGAEVAERWVSNYGPLNRLLGQFKEDGTPEVFLHFPLGNIADPESPHFDDGTDDWRDGHHPKLLYERDEIEAALEKRVVLE